MSWKPATWRRTGFLLLAVAAIAAVSTVGLMAFGLTAGSSGTDGTGVTGTPSSAAGSGLPVGPVLVLGVEAVQPVADAGRVPLNTAVQGEWRLRNTGTTPVSLGRPGIEVLEGC